MSLSGRVRAIEGEVAGQCSVGVGLGEEGPGLLLDGLDGVGAGHKANGGSF